MSWTNIRLILAREIRDQLRDRRTLFMMAVLPVLLYPLLGMSFLQISQFMHEHPVSVAVFGAENLPPTPRLIDEDHFAASLFSSAEQVGLLRVKPVAGRRNQGKQEALEAAESGDYDAVVFVPPDFAVQLERFHRLMTAATSSGSRLPSGTTEVLPGRQDLPPSGTSVVPPGRRDLPATPAVEVPSPRFSGPRPATNRRWPACGWTRYWRIGGGKSCFPTWRPVGFPRRRPSLSNGRRPTSPRRWAGWSRRSGPSCCR
jgi:hypothetical protein